MSRSKKSVISAFYLILDSVFQKLIGLVSTLILARILVPDDFGIIAIAALAYGFIEVFSQTGSNQYVISRQTIDDDLVNSAWTLDVMVKLVVFVLMQMAALPVSEYYDNPEIEALFRAYPVLLLLGAFTSPSIWLLIRDQNLKRYFTMQVVAKIFSVIVTVSIALIYRSYWALIIGQIVSTTLKMGLSYMIHPYRPRLCFRGMKAQLSFSAYMIPQELFGYIKANIDSFFISRNYSENAFGNFHIMKYISFLPSMNIIGPITQPLLTEVAKDHQDETQRVYNYSITFLIVLLIATPIALFCILNSQLMLLVLLGEQWLTYHAIFASLSVLIITLFMVNHAKRALIASSKTNLIFVYEGITASLVAGSIFLNLDNNLVTLIQWRTLTEVITAAMFLFFTTWFYLGADSGYFWRKQSFALLGMMLLGLSTWKIQQLHWFDTLPNVLHLAMEGVVFGLCYLIIITVLYYIYYYKTDEGQHIFRLLNIRKLLA